MRDLRNIFGLLAIYCLACSTSPVSSQEGGLPSYLPAYKAVPRLVPVKVGERELLEASEGRNVRITTARPFPLAQGAPPSPHYSSSPAPISYTYLQQPGEALPLIKRIRVNPSAATPQYASAPGALYPTYPQVTAAAASPSPIQYSQAVPAVNTYKAPLAPAVYKPVTYSSQPVYYAQPQVQPLAVKPKVVAAPARPLLKVQQQRPLLKQVGEEVEDEYPADPNPQYNFAFDVKDDDFTNYQNRQETRDGGVIKGSYSVVDPDGYVRTVTYEASPKGGFQAKVTREPTDVKIKFPVPTTAPEEEAKLGRPVLQYASAVQPQQYGGQQYVAKRFPQRVVAPQYAQ